MSIILFVKRCECSFSDLCPVFVLRTTSYCLRTECGDDALGVHLQADRCYASVCTWIAYIRFCFLCGYIPAVYIVAVSVVCMYVATAPAFRPLGQSQSFLGEFAALLKATIKPGTHYPHVTWAHIKQTFYFQLLPYPFPCVGSHMLIFIIWWLGVVLTLRLLMSYKYIYIWSTYSWCF